MISSENLAKRQVKSPKVFLSDSGLLHTLLGLPTMDALRGHAKAGASFEGFAMSAVIEHTGARPHECYFWALHSGPELDLLFVRGDRRIGFEFKMNSAPDLTASMHAACTDLELSKLWVVHPGKERFALSPLVEALPLRMLPDTKVG